MASQFSPGEGAAAAAFLKCILFTQSVQAPGTIMGLKSTITCA
jgi:hypothetical protein